MPTPEPAEKRDQPLTSRRRRSVTLGWVFSSRERAVRVALFFDGKNASVALDWVATPSGLALDKGRKWLYLTSLTGSVWSLVVLLND